MIKIVKLPMVWVQRGQGNSMGAGMVVLLVHVLVMGTLVRDMIVPAAVI